MKKYNENFKSVKFMKNMNVRNLYLKNFIHYEMPIELQLQKKLFQLTVSQKTRMSSVTLKYLLAHDGASRYYKNIFMMPNHMHLDEYVAKKFWFYNIKTGKPEFMPILKKDSQEYEKVFKESTSKLASVYQLVLNIHINDNLDKVIKKINNSGLKPTLIIHSYDRIYVFYRLNDNIIPEQAEDMLDKCKRYFKYKLHLDVNEQFSLTDFVPLIFSISTFVPDTMEKVTYVNYPVVWNDNRYDVNQLHHFLNKEIKQLKIKNIIKPQKQIKPHKNQYKIKFNLDRYLKLVYDRLKIISQKQYCNYKLEDLVTVAYAIIYLCSHSKSGQSILCPHIKQKMITKKFLVKIIPSMSGSKSIAILRYLIAIGFFNKENSIKTIQNREYLQRRIQYHQLAGFITLATITDLLKTTSKAKQLFKYSKDNNLNVSRLSLINYTMALGYKTIIQNFATKLIWHLFHNKGTSMTQDMYQQVVQYYDRLYDEDYQTFMEIIHHKIFTNVSYDFCI